MKICALDLSKRSTGWATWDGKADKPIFGHWVLGSEYTSDGGVYAKLHACLHDLWRLTRFEFIYYEQPIMPANLAGHTNIATLTIAAGLAAHVESFGYAIRCRRIDAINVSSWRKDFISADLVKDAQAVARAKRKATGKGSARDKLKALTMERCRQLGFSPRRDDEADAIGILDYAIGLNDLTPPWRADEVLRAPLGMAG